MDKNKDTNSFDNTIIENIRKSNQGSKEKLEGRFFGEYQILTQIGQGGMGVVYKGYDTKLNRTVAIKMSTLDEKERFLTEAQTMAKLSHGNIISIYDTGTQEDKPYIVMEYISGPSLKEFIEQYSPSYKQITEWMIQIGKAMEYAHQQGVIHRDLKPSNIMLANNTIPKVMDFGLAKDITEQKQLSQTGMIIGSIYYMSPEQASGNINETDAQTDIYMLGAILYQMLTSKPPFEGTYIEIINKVISTPPIPPKDINPKVPPQLESICLKALAKEKSKRYSSANEWVQDLENFINHQPTKARTLGRFRRSMKKFRRNSLSPWFTLLLIGYIFISAIFIYQTSTQALITTLNIRTFNQHEEEKSIFTDLDKLQLEISWDTKEYYTDIDVYGKHINYQKIRHTNKKGRNNVRIPLIIDKKMSQNSMIVNISLFVKDTFYRQKITVPLNYGNISIYRANSARTGVYIEKTLHGKPKLLWKKNIASGYYDLSSSPTVHGDVVYVLTRQNRGKQIILAMNKTTGNIIWQCKTPEEKKNAIYYPDASPTITYQYVVTPIDEKLCLLEKHTGKILWKIRNIATPEEKMLGKIFQMQTNGSPIVEKNMIYVGSQNAHCVIDKDKLINNDNKEPWDANIRDGGSHSCAMDEENVYYIQGYNNHENKKTDYVIARNKKTNQILWKHDLQIRIYRSGVPAVSENNVYIIARNTLYSLSKNSINQKGKINWTFTPKTQKYFGILDIKFQKNLDEQIPNRDFQRAFNKNGIKIPNAHLLKKIKIIETGKKWELQQVENLKTYVLKKEKEKITLYGNYVTHSSPAINKGIIYFSSADGYIYAIDQNSGKKIWSYKTGGSAYSSPSIAEGIVYVGSNDHHLYALDAMNGALMWKFKTGNKVMSSVCVSDGKIYMTSSDGSIYALH